MVHYSLGLKIKMKPIKNFFYFLFLLWPLDLRASEVLTNLKTAAGGTGLITDQSPAGIISTVINALLGLLGTAFVVLIILGGFRWMTSRGNKDAIEEAKKTIVNATIGLAIVLASYIIVRFVIEAIVGATSAGGGANVSS